MPPKRTRTVSQTTTTVVAKKPRLATTSLKSSILRLAETKKAIKSISGSFSVVNPLAVNANYFLSEGVRRREVVGTSLYLQSIDLRGLFLIENNTNTGYNHTSVRISLIRSITSYNNSVGNLTASDVFRNDGSASSSVFATTSHFDTDKVKVLWDSLIEMPQSITVGTGNSVGKNFKKTIPIKKLHKITADNTGTFQEGQYFWVFGLHKNGDGAVSSAGTYSLQWSLNFKDM